MLSFRNKSWLFEKEVVKIIYNSAASFIRFFFIFRALCSYLYKMKIISKTFLVLIALFLFGSTAFSQETAEKFFAKGVEIMKSGRYQPAIPFFDEAIRLNPNYAEAFLERSRAKSNNQRDLKGAMADIEKVLEIDPQLGEAYFERARLRNSMIIEMLKEKGPMPTQDVLPYNKAVLEDLNLAIENGLKKNSYSYRAEYQSRHFDNQAEAIKDYTTALTYDKDDIQLLMGRAGAKRRNDDLQGSSDDLREVVRRYDEAKNNKQIPSQKLAEMKGAAVMALVNLSSNYALDEKPEQQLWAIEKSIELAPSASAYVSRGRYKLIFGNLDDSIADYTKAIELSGGKIGHYFMDRGVAYQLNGKTAEAEADFEQGRKIDPNLKNYNLRYWLELAKRQREQQRVKVELPN